jgi:hypothetical protein
MTQKLIFTLVTLTFLCFSTSAQKTKSASKNQGASSSQLSYADKMGYARTSKYWGPGTYYCYAPGAPTNKMANNAESRMRDLIGIWAEDYYKEIAKQGFVEVPKNEMKKWFNPNNSKDLRFFYSPDKSYILRSGIKSLDNSPAMPDGHRAQVSADACRFRLIAKEDTAEVMKAIWQYFRDLHEMKVILGSMASDFKKAKLKVYPIQRVGTAGWAGLRAGSFVLVMEDSKPKGYYQYIDDILKRTITNPEFILNIMGGELAYDYGLHISLQKEGYVLRYDAVSAFFKELEPGRRWENEYPTTLKQYQDNLKSEKEAVEYYKKAPQPPVLLDLDKVLHQR